MADNENFRMDLYVQTFQIFEQNLQLHKYTYYVEVYVFMLCNFTKIIHHHVMISNNELLTPTINKLDYFYLSRFLLTISVHSLTNSQKGDENNDWLVW